MSGSGRWPFRGRDEQPTGDPIGIEFHSAETAESALTPHVPPDHDDPRYPELLRRIEALEALEALEAREAATGHLARYHALELEVSELRKGLAAVMSRLDRAPAETAAAPASARPAPLVDRVWSTAPLTARLTFVQAALDPGSSTACALKEASELLRLSGQRHELETWIQQYPSLFVDAFAALATTEELMPITEAESLAHSVLDETRMGLENALRTMGLEWIVPRVGDAVSDAHSVAGDETVSGVAAGRVARCLRRGFRWRGRVQLPAMVLRQPEATDTGGLPERPPTAVGAPDSRLEPAADPSTESITRLMEAPTSVAADERSSPVPDWLTALIRSTPEGDTGTAAALTRGLVELAERTGSHLPLPSDYDLTVALKPLLALLGAGGGTWRPDLPSQWTGAFQQVRPDLLSWLSDTLSLRVIVPTVGQPFSAETMLATAERRTAHPHERGTVARVEMPGLQCEDRVLLPARVIRYESGGGD